MSADLLKLLSQTTLACSFAILLVLILRLPLRKVFGARVSYLIWCLVPLAIIAVLVPAQEVVVTITASQPVATGVTAVAGSPVLPVQEAHFPENLFLLLWLSGIAACGYWFSRQQKKFIDGLGVLNQRGINVFSSENNLQGPSVIGVLKPRIVLPSDFDERYNAEEKSLVLTHEYVHVARGDTRINLLVATLRCIFWFNPLLHWADAKFRFDQELSTDAKVLSQFPSKRKSYADAMLKTQMASIGLPIACHWQAHHPLKERILMLKKSGPGKFFRIFGVSVVSVLCLAAAFAAWSAQPEKIIVASSGAGLLYDIRMEAKVDHVDQKPITLREIPGKAFAVSLGEKDSDWSYQFTVTPVDSQFMFIKGEIRYGKTLISEPAMKIANGKNSAISVMTKDGSSLFDMNFTVSQIRDGKLVPPMPFNGDRGEANGTYLIQDRDGKGQVMTYADLVAQVPEPVSNDKIKTQARIIPGSLYVQLQETARKAGYKSMKVEFTVGAQGELYGAGLDGNYRLDESTARKLNGLLAKQRFEPAKDMNDVPVVSKLSVEF